MWRIVVIALLLAGCAEQGLTKAESEARDIGLAIDRARKQTSQCADGIERSPAYEKLSDRITVGKPPMTMLADKRKPTATDVPLLLEIHSQLAACRAQSIQLWALVHPTFVSGVATTYTEADIDFAKLVRRDISWGDYAQLSLERFGRFQSRYDAAAQRIKAGLDKSHDREMQERQAATRALGAWAQAQRAAFPIYTNCVYAGPILSCTSY